MKTSASLADLWEVVNQIGGKDGYFFGNIPIIRQNLNVIVLVGIGAAAIPIVLAAIYKIFQRKKN